MAIVDRPGHLADAVEHLCGDKYVIVNMFDETKTSYKGYCSWALLANSNKLYLIDCLNLHDHLGLLAKVLFLINLGDWKCRNSEAGARLPLFFGFIQKGLQDIPYQFLWSEPRFEMSSWSYGGGLGFPKHLRFLIADEPWCSSDPSPHSQPPKSVFKLL